MSQFVSRIPVDKASVYAFEITGRVSADAMESMAKQMNAAFDAHEEKVDMLLLFRDFEGNEFGASFDGEVISSRFRALTNVDKYVVVGAPDSAETMLDMMGAIIPVETHTFDLEELNQAWALLGVSPSTTPA